MQQARAGASCTQRGRCGLTFGVHTRVEFSRGKPSSHTPVAAAFKLQSDMHVCLTPAWQHGASAQACCACGPCLGPMQPPAVQPAMRHQTTAVTGPQACALPGCTALV